MCLSCSRSARTGRIRVTESCEVMMTPALHTPAKVLGDQIDRAFVRWTGFTKNCGMEGGSAQCPCILRSCGD
jgi:hypothetical protein